MTLENKYNVPRETIKRMVDDGIIAPCVVNHYDILDEFKRLKALSPARSNYDIFCQLAQETKMSTSMIDKIVYQLRKR